MAVAGTIANAGSWEEIAQFPKGREDWFSQHIELPGDTPSHDTFERVFKWVDGKEFERAFILWMREICTDKELEIVAIDGKTMRDSGDKASGKKPLHIVSAWASGSNLALEQVKTGEKSNEITAMPELLKLLDVKRAVVRIDDMGAQKEIAEKIIEKKADYVLSVKKNQPTMHEDIRYFMEKELEESCGFEMVHRTIADSRGTLISEEKACSITSLKGNVHNFSDAVRAHWVIETTHWTLDVVLNEDKRTVRKGDGAQNLSVLKRMTLNILRGDKTLDKATGPQKRFRSCRDVGCLAKMLSDM